jgi:ABC-type transport system involved in multi-copper enzyme maturation permease subunit
VMLIVLVRNELEKTWRSRWIVFAVLGGLFLLIAVGLYSFYVYQAHRWSPPPPVAWQTRLRTDINNGQMEIDNLERFRQQQAAGSGGRGVRINGNSLDDAEAQVRQRMSADQYLIDHDIAPLSAYSITGAALFGLGGIIMFVLVRILGWLAAEQIAGERSDRTIAMLLSRPPSRDQYLLAKAIASFLIGLAVVVLSFLVVYAILAFVLGSAGPLIGQVGVAIDGSKPLGPENIVVMPILLFVLMSLGAAMLAVLCVQGMSLLISVLTGRWAAIGITLAVLFGAAIVSSVVSGIIVIISGSPNSAHFLNYVFFNVLAPVGSLAPVFGNGATGVGQGMGEFGSEVATLAVWTVAFFTAAWLFFHHKQETG